MSRLQIEGLVCPELDFSLFCRRVADRDLSSVMDAAGMESSLLYREYRERAGRHTFRGGTKQRRYVEDLQHLVYLLSNGSYPSHCDDRFFLAVAPLVNTLLLKWRIGNLREVFSPENVEVHVQREGGRDPVLATILAARDAGKIAAQELMERWREEHGIQQQYGYQAFAVLNLAVRANSRIAIQLFELSAKYPFVLRVDRGRSSGIVVTIHKMTTSLEQGLNVAADEAALGVLRARLGVDGYVTSDES